MTRGTWLLFVGLSIVWGLPYFFVKIALADLGPAWIAFGRVALAAIVLVGFVPRADWTALAPRAAAIVAVAVTDIALPFLLIANGERSVSSSLTGIVLSAIPLTVALLAFAIGPREPIGAAQLAGLAIGLGGVAALLGFNAGHDTGVFGGLALIGGAMLSYSAGVLMIKRWLNDTPKLATTAAMLAVAAIILAPFALLTVPARLPSAGTLIAVAILGLVCTAAAYLMYFALISRAGVIRATVVTYLNPAVAAVLGVSLLHESMSGTAVAGLLLIIAGSWLSTGGPPPSRRISVTSTSSAAAV